MILKECNDPSVLQFFYWIPQQGCRTIYFHLKIAVDQNLKIFTSNHFENKLWSLSKTTPQTRVSIVCYLSIINCASISISSVHHSAITVFTVFCTIHNIRAQNLYIGLYDVCRYVYIIASCFCSMKSLLYSMKLLLYEQAFRTISKLPESDS